MMLFQTLIAALVLWGVYILPGIIAIRRGHPDGVAILILNIMLGWTLLFWVVALVWGLRRTAAPKFIPAHHPGGPRWARGDRETD